jgi:uncharacterized protein YhdP
MDISADRVVWEELAELIEGEAKGGNNKGLFGIPLPPLEGTVRLNADSFTFAGYSWKPVKATASLSPNGIKGEIQQANVCGVGTSGKVNFIDGEIALDLSLAVTEGQLQPTSLCLTHNRHAMTGSYTLRAQVSGQGAPEKLLAQLRGGFEFRARDGEFSQSGPTDTALETIFDYLNDKGDLGVAFPDLDRESFPFRSLRVQGTLDGMTLVNRELAIQSTLYDISGYGNVDLEHQQIDARGLITMRVPGQSLVRRIPLVGSILGIGGSILGIPVRVIGSLENPTVTYLSPSDVGAELLNIPVRILGLPLEAIRLFNPNTW